MKFQLFLFFILFNFPLFSQINLTIKFLDYDSNPLVGVQSSLQSDIDSLSKFKFKSNNLGIINPVISQRGNYHFIASYLGYKNIDTFLQISELKNNFIFVFNNENKTLKTIEVRAQKNLLTMEEDKIIVDPEVLVASSTNSMEVLEQTPGVFIDPNGNIYINGASPAKVYINGREQKLGETELSAIMKSISPKDIEKIEIIKSPSAKYSSNSTGGIVNVVLKKGVKLGRTGNLSAGFNQWKYNTSFIQASIQKQDSKNTKYISLFLNKDNNYEKYFNNRNLISDTFLTQNNYSFLPQNLASSKFGIAHQFSDKFDISTDFLVSYSSQNKSIDSKNDFITSNITSNNSSTFTNSKNNTFIFNPSLNSKYIIDSLSQIEFNFNFTNTKTNVNEKNDIIFPNSIYSLIADGTKKINSTNTELKLDYIYRKNSFLKIESGFLFSNTALNSKNNYNYTYGTNSFLDSIRTNSYNYNQNIFAAYIQNTSEVKKIVFKYGLRAENTAMNGLQTIPNDTNFKNNQLNLFPYLFVSRDIIKIMGFPITANFIARRSITRPDYSMLNPSINFVNQFLYSIGNPSLKPQITQQFEFNISADNHPLFTLGKRITEGVFNQVIYTNPINENQMIQTYDNLGKNQEFYFQAMAAKPPGKKYFIVVGTEYNFSHYTGIYQNLPLDFQRGSWRFFAFQRFMPIKNLSFNLFAFYMNKGYAQFYEFDNYGAMFTSAKYTLKKHNIDISLYMKDILYTSNIHFTYDLGNINSYGYRYSDSRRIGIKFDYFFGKKDKENSSMFKIGD